MAGKLLSAPATLLGATLGTDVTTRQEARDVLSVVPGSHLYGVKAAPQWAAQFPKSDPDKSFR